MVNKNKVGNVIDRLIIYVHYREVVGRVTDVRGRGYSSCIGGTDYIVVEDRVTVRVSQFCF